MNTRESGHRDTGAGGILDGILEVFEMSLSDLKNICRAMAALSAKLLHHAFTFAPAESA
jgi:hypothetical protein